MHVECGHAVFGVWQALKVQYDALLKMQLCVDRHQSRGLANISCEYEG